MATCSGVPKQIAEKSIRQSDRHADLTADEFQTSLRRVSGTERHRRLNHERRTADHNARQTSTLPPRPSPARGRRRPRAPDLELDGADINPLPSTGRDLLHCFTDSPALRRVADGWSQRIDVITTATHQQTLAPVLIRPDGYIAAALDNSSDMDGLHAAMTQWFGPSPST